MNTTFDKRSSGFLSEDEIFQKIEKLSHIGSTSECYRVQINRELFFMKRLRPQYANDPKYRLIIEKEYKIGKSIESPYTPKYITFNDSGKSTYILMEYINGESIEEKLNSNPEYFHCGRNLYKLTLQLLKGLRLLHSKKILHLDLTPHNIILTQIGNDVRIVDFGFCMTDSYIHTAGTTPEFAAPELLEHRFKDIDESTDIYAVGSLLQYIENKTGKKLPHRLQKIKRRCLQQQKQKRYATANDIIRILENRKAIFWSKFIAVAAVIAIMAAAFFKCGLYTAIDNYIGWKQNRFPTRFEADGIFYNITDSDERTVEVTFKGNNPDEFEYEYKNGEVDIPQSVTYNGREFTVTAIAGQAFKNPYISRINIPEGIKVIKDSAFIYCNLSEILSIPASVEYFGLSNIYPALYIDSIAIDKENPFYDSRQGCNAIIETATNTLIAGCKNTVIPYGVERIAKDAFVCCEELKNISIPATVKEIGAKAFAKSKITEVNIPEGVTTLEEYTFQYCEYLQNVTLPESLTEIRLAALSHCGFRELLIPNGVRTIGDYAFDYCEKLETVTIGSGVQEIGYCAFDGCKRLERVISHIPAESLFEIDRSVFGNINNDCILYVPKGSKKVYENTFGWDVFSKIEEM